MVKFNFSRFGETKNGCNFFLVSFSETKVGSIYTLAFWVFWFFSINCIKSLEFLFSDIISNTSISNWRWFQIFFIKCDFHYCYTFIVIMCSYSYHHISPQYHTLLNTTMGRVIVYLIFSHFHNHVYTDDFSKSPLNTPSLSSENYIPSG